MFVQTPGQRDLQAVIRLMAVMIIFFFYNTVLKYTILKNCRWSFEGNNACGLIIFNVCIIVIFEIQVFLRVQSKNSNKNKSTTFCVLLRK